MFAGLRSFGQKTAFIENKGQWIEDFDFKMPLSNGAVFINSNKMILSFGKSIASNQLVLSQEEKMDRSLHPNAIRPGDLIEGHAYEVELIGARIDITALKNKRQKTYHNYLLGKDLSRWKSKVGLYGEVSYRNVYDGIDIKYYFNDDGNLKYDWVIKPDADPKQIELHYKGTEGLRLVYGNLIVKTSIENIMESAPYAYQVINGKKREVECDYVINGNHVQFKLGKYDEDKELIIDPVLIFSTYTGSGSDNFGYTATYGIDGSAYGGGIVYPPAGSSYPVSLGAFQDTFQGGVIDIGISKFTADGSGLVFSTYLGGDGVEMPHSIVEADNKELVIVGSTGSQNFPVTTNAYDTSFTISPPDTVRIGGSVKYVDGSEIFVTKLDSTGGVLIGSTFFGGNSRDGINGAIKENYGDENRADVTVDDLGNIYVAGNTRSTDLPNVGGHTPSDTLTQDGIVFSFNSDLTTLNWSTYLAGQNQDAALSLKIGSSGTLYVAGITNSSDLGNLYSGGNEPNHLGDFDGFIVAMDAATGAINHFTYNGTPQNDRNFLLDIDDDENVYVFGQTRGSYPVLGDSVFSQTHGSQFIHQLNDNLSASIRSMIFGDSVQQTLEISPTAFMVDNCRNVYAAGWGDWNRSVPLDQLPITNNISNINGARMTSDVTSDFYFMILDASWKKVNFGTYFGQNGGVGDHVDGGTSRFNKDGTIYHAVCAGCGGSSNFPTSHSAYSTQNGSSNCNMAVLKLRMEQEVTVNFEPDKDTACIPYTVNLSNNSYNADVYSIEYPDGSIQNIEPVTIVVNNKGVNKYKIYGMDTTCGFIDSLEIVLVGLSDSVKTDFSSDNDSCSGNFLVNFQNASQNASSYIWYFGDGGFSNNINPSHQYAEAGRYKVQLIANSNYCGGADTTFEEVVIKSLSQQSGFLVDYVPCNGDAKASFRSLSNDFEHYIWIVDGVEVAADTTFIQIEFDEIGAHVIELQSLDSSCERYFTSKQTIDIKEGDGKYEMPNVFTPNGDGQNETFGIIGEFSTNYFMDFSFKIFNRWGIELYSSTSFKGTWNGKFEDNDVPQGVYYYVIIYKDLCGKNVEDRGFVHLLR